MDVSDAPANESVMLAFLPINPWWCKLDLPHMTLVYAGTKSSLRPSDFNTLAKDAATIASLCTPFSLEVTKLDVFGDEEKVDVVRLRPTAQVLAARRIVQHWNASQHSFSPHVTLGPAFSGIRDVPPSIAFDQIMVGWGNDSIVFKL